MKKSLFIFSVLISFFLMSSVYSFIYINEIKFKGDEFVEIYSNETLNLTRMKVYDEGNSDSNELSLLKNFSSNYTLIIGKNFNKNNNIRSLNCIIYITNRDLVSNRGLSNKGENLIIQINNKTNISWTKDKDYDYLEDGETLNFNYEDENYYVSNSTPCLPNLELEQMQNHSNNSLNETEQLQIPHNNSNTSQNQSENSTSCNSYTFEIILIPDENIFESKIQYKFETNAEENYSISYWIENYGGELVRSKRETANTNVKSYTPRDFTQVYRIKAYLEYRGCKIEDERVVSFYSDNEEDIEEEDDAEDTYTDDEIVFESQNEKTKVNSQYFILLGLSSLLGIMLFKW